MKQNILSQNMKAALLLLLTIAVMLCAFPLQAMALSEEKEMYIYMDHKEVEFEVEPVIVNGTTLVQFRPLFEAMGMDIEWDPDTRTVTGTKERYTLKLQIDNQIASVNGKDYELPVSPKIIKGSTMVPIRFVAESFGRSVYYKPGYGAAEIQINREMGTDIYEALYVAEELQYTGESKDGKPHGKGTYTLKGELWYEGEFYQGDMEGKGKLYLTTTLGDQVYEGEFEDNLPNGKGIITEGNYRYEGDMKNGLRHGTGRVYYKDKLEYEGDMWENTLTGEGTIYQSDGTKYVGDVIMGAREGYARVYDQDGDLFYEGMYAGNHPAVSPLEQKWIAFYLYTEHNKTQKAAEAFEAFKKAAGDESLAYKIAGSAFLELDQTEQSVAYLNKGIALAPDDAELHALIALAYSRIGDDAKAEEHAENAEKLGFEEMDELREAMEEIKTNP